MRKELLDQALGALDPARMAEALAQLLGEAIEVLPAGFVEVRRRASAALPVDAVAIDFRGQALRLSLLPEPDLLRSCVARLLEQKFELGWADTGIDAALRGAGAALVLEAARRAARGEAPVLATEPHAGTEWILSARATLRLGGRPYGFDVVIQRLGAPSTRRLDGPRAPLARLGSVRLAVPWVAALSSAPLGVLDRLEAGDVWLPGAAAWVGGEPGPHAGLLIPPRSGRGLPVRAVSGRTVLGADAVRVPQELEASMSQEEAELEQIVGEMPLVVRLEIGALEMSAAEWAALRPGDVVQSGRRIEDPVILRAGGQEIARGELVDIEGEIGVRITQVGAQLLSPAARMVP
jgi:flagellar motor switch/type III secretory pathway protein FliN